MPITDRKSPVPCVLVEPSPKVASMLSNRHLELQNGEEEHQNHERGLQQTTPQSNETQERKKLDQCSAEAQHACTDLDQRGDETAAENATLAAPSHSSEGEGAYDVHDLMAAWSWKREHLYDLLSSGSMCDSVTCPSRSTDAVVGCCIVSNTRQGVSTVRPLIIPAL